jgi:propionyl-CoA carboxylase alpha chain
MRIGQDFTVVVLGPEGKHQHQLVHVEEYQGHGNLATIKVGERSYRIESPSRLGEIRINGTVNGTPFVAQVERGTTRNPLVLHVQHNGARLEALVLTPRQAELHKLMPYKPPPDLSRYLLSPMPGLLAGVAVQPGQKVRTGDRLAVIEAMKMENILVAARDGVVKTVTATQGDSLAVGQVILEFE